MSTWTTQLTTLEQRAAEHDKFATQLVQNLAEPLRILAGRTEELRKLHEGYAGKLEKERDGAYGDLRKMKAKYDSVCQEVESRRKKVDSAFDMGKAKAQVAYQQQMSEMHNVKVRVGDFMNLGLRLTALRTPTLSASTSRTNRKSATTTHTSRSFLTAYKT
jgi:formin-binding protein 1